MCNILYIYVDFVFEYFKSIGLRVIFQTLNHAKLSKFPLFVHENNNFL